MVGQEEWFNYPYPSVVINSSDILPVWCVSNNNELQKPTTRPLARNIKVSGFGIIIIYEILMSITSSVVPVSKPLRHTG